MNKILFLFIFSFISLCSCNMTPKKVSNIGGTIIECKFPDMKEKGEMPEQILEILKTRVSYLKDAKNHIVTYNDTTSVFRIEMPGVTDINAELLVSNGEMSICEMYTKQSIEGIIYNVLSDTLLCSYIDPSSLNSRLYSDGCFVGGIKDKDRAAIDSILEKKRSIWGLPYNLKFYWSWNEDNNTPVKGYLLYMVKITDNNIDLGLMHQSSQIEPNSSSDYEYINIKLNDLGAAKFAQMTERNIGLPLAIVSDGRVLSAPNVASIIEGGNLNISGDFTNSFLGGLLGLLNSKNIKSKAEILSAVVKGGNQDKIKKPQ